MEKNQSLNEFNKLNEKEKGAVIKILLGVRRQYDISQIQVDMPYFFYSINKNMFFGEKEKTNFLNIDNAEEFGIQIIYYISRYILMMRNR
jgi:hypothetical protein